MVAQKIDEARSAKKPMRRADEADWLFSDPMRHEGRQYITRGRVVDEHDVEVQCFQRAQKLGGPAGAQDELNIGPAENGPQKLHLEVARQGGERPDPQRLARRTGFAKRA